MSEIFMKLVSVSEMLAIEQEANASGISSNQMMENAGKNIADEVMQRNYFPSGYREVEVLGLVGSGHNGGDTLIALTWLAKKGWHSHAYLINRKTGNDKHIQFLEDAGGDTNLYEEDMDFSKLNSLLETTNIILDGILGTGVKLPLKEDVGNVLTNVKVFLKENETPIVVVAVDCPSGINSDTGDAAEQTIHADLTLTMAAIKRGLLKLPANSFTGEIKVIGIGDLNHLQSWKSIMDDVGNNEMISKMLPNRPTDSHKGSFGTAIVVAGSTNYTGAALLAGKAAARAGVGLVTMAIPAPLHPILAGHFPEATWILLPHEMGVVSENAFEVLSEYAGNGSAILLGPGLGLEETTGEFIKQLLTNKMYINNSSKRIGFLQRDLEVRGTEKPKDLPPMIVDADGLKLLAKIEGWFEILPNQAILTPHPGEMAILTSLPIEEIQADRINVARRFSSEWGHVIVLKGAFTVIASPDGRTTTIPVATSALAHAGTGDVLAGLITGLRAQGMEAYEAAIAGAWIHARAGLIAAEFQGNSATVLAGDILDSIAEVMNELN
jgi:ADP-dependent NAD(P)H-hydrate dehydratase / NAD(P)H-hydrate epimerase